MATRIVKGSFLEGAPVSFECEWPQQPSGTLWQQADFTGCTLTVFDVSTGFQVGTPSRSVAQVLTNFPMSWDLSPTGNNFHDLVTTTEVDAEGGHTYQFEYAFFRADGYGYERLVFIGGCQGIGAA